MSEIARSKVLLTVGVAAFILARSAPRFVPALKLGATRLQK